MSKIIFPVHRIYYAALREKMHSVFLLLCTGGKAMVDGGWGALLLSFLLLFDKQTTRHGLPV